MPVNKQYFSDTNLKLVKVVPGRESQAWDEVAHTCTYLTKWGIETLRKGLDGYLKSILIEPHYICKDYRNIFSFFYSKKFNPRPYSCTRLHFFNSTFSEVNDFFNENPNDDTYIGFSIIQPVAPRCLGRTVIDPYKCGKDQDKFYSLATSFTTHIQGIKRVIHGYPYISQSAEAMVCSHAALWGVCRYLSERYTSYREIFPYDLIAMTGDTKGRRVPYRGMTYADYSTILSLFGCYPVIIHPKGDWNNDIEAYYDIYAYLESGIPILASFRGHVATLIGHTTSDSILPGHQPNSTTGFYNSYSLLKQYVIIDDNFFPYQLLGYKNDPDNYSTSISGFSFGKPSIEYFHAAVAPLPEKAFMEPRVARIIGENLFNDGMIRRDINLTLSHINIKNDQLVSRLFLASSISFKKRKFDYFNQKNSHYDELCQLPTTLNLPHFMWIMEVSSLGLHNSGKCLAEVAIDASATIDEEPLIYARIGNIAYVAGKRIDSLSAPKYFPQFTHNLGEKN